MDDESRDMSLRLSKILEKIGVSERMRQLRKEMIIREEIHMAVKHRMMDDHYSVYIFGSSIEGSTTPGMNSDRDVVYCNESYPVIDDVHHASAGRESLLSVRDEQTKPGYVKLQLVGADSVPLTVHNCTPDDPQLVSDTMGRVCIKHRIMMSAVKAERSGPADSYALPGLIDMDMVYAVRSRTFPRAAMESLLECAQSGWLTMPEIEEMIQYGCLYVGVGHPSSEEKELEWRISFSLQERKLMFKLNPTQHQCYVLLKFIKNMLTSKPDVGKSITSYHCKTCLFRVINKTRLEEWRPDNLIACTLVCLAELLQCVREGTCPNFFIRTNNMFERRVYGEVKERLIHHLTDMLNDGYTLFYDIRSEHIGEALRGHHDRSTDMSVSRYSTVFGIFRNSFRYQGVCIMDMAKHMKRYTKEETTRFLFQQLCHLSSVNTITEHTQDETKAAVRELEVILHRFYAAHLASLAFSSDVHESRHRLLQFSSRHLQHAMTHDLMTGRLLYASILYRQGNIDMCRDLLERLEQSLHKSVQTVCGCYNFQTCGDFHHVLLLLYHNRDPPAMLKSSIALCTLFLPSHTEIIPTALQYEMYRSVATPPGSCNIRLDDWFDVAVVDSNVYLFFLQYLVYSQLNRPAARRLAIDKLLKQLLHAWNLGHRETGYNLLGWIYSQEGQIEAAAYCFLQSWRIRPHHNAAKWHMLNLIYHQYVDR